MGIIRDTSDYFGADGSERYLVDLADTKSAFIKGEIGEEEAAPMRGNLSPDNWRRLVCKRFIHQHQALIEAASAESRTGALLAAFIREMF